MDVLSDVLRTISLRGALYFKVDAAHPWVSVNPSMKQIGAAMLPGAQHVIPFHIMLEGKAWAKPEGSSLSPACIEAGDVVMFPLGASHLISSDPEIWGASPADISFYFKAAASDVPFTMVTIGKSGTKSAFVCGYLGCDELPFNPFLGSLPEMLNIKGHMDKDGLMERMMWQALAEKEANKAGSETVIAKLSELIFIQALREYMAALIEMGARNWVTALGDQQLGKALELLHGNPAGKWTLQQIARECGMSRSALSERFSRHIGCPPMHYLGMWRMQLASKLLSQGASMGKVAEQVGYSSEAAFQRAFKKIVGTTPGEWRARA